MHRAASRMESSWTRLRARRPSPEGSSKIDGSENVISRRFSKPSKPIGEGGGGGSLAIAENFSEPQISVKVMEGREVVTQEGRLLFFGFVLQQLRDYCSSLKENKEKQRI